MSNRVVCVVSLNYTKPPPNVQYNNHDIEHAMMSLVSLVDRIDHALSPYSRPLNLQYELLCSARYTIDQRWYRAKVIDHLSNRGKVKLKFNVDGILGLALISLPLSLRSKFISLTIPTLKRSLPPALVLSWTSIRFSRSRCSSVALVQILSSPLAKERYM